MNNILELHFRKYSSLESMPHPDRLLIREAASAAKRSFAPYSNFSVGAAAILRSGQIIYGSNVESEVYPAGICAERNLLFAAATAYPFEIIDAIAIFADNGARECYPCGVCRQSLLDAQRRQESPIRVIMASCDSATVVDSADVLMPFSFKL